jgi:hypothetical protein
VTYETAGCCDPEDPVKSRLQVVESFRFKKGG